MERRNTIQKDLVLKTVQELKRHLTADEVYEFIKKEHPTIGRGTVYRNLKAKIRDTHGMEFLGYDIFFKGICPACRTTEG